MADFKGRKKGKSHVQNAEIFFDGSGHGPESLCQISAYYVFCISTAYYVFCLHVFCISTGLLRLLLGKLIC